VRRLQILAVVVVGSGWFSACFHEEGGGGGPLRDVVAMAPAGVELADWHLRCRTDIDCGAGFRCIIPAGASIRNGVCGTVVDHEGVRLAKRPRAVPACVVRQDCPLAFSCLKVSSLDGLCVK
jgi:hypothetical protein